MPCSVDYSQQPIGDESAPNETYPGDALRDDCAGVELGGEALVEAAAEDPNHNRQLRVTSSRGRTEHIERQTIFRSSVGHLSVD